MREYDDSFPPHIRVLNALLWTLGPALAAAGWSGTRYDIREQAFAFLLVLGVMSVIVGRYFHDWPELGARSGRPLMAGIGFALIGWVGMLVARFMAVEIVEVPLTPLGGTWLWLFFLEALCVHLWAYGLLFRTLADWRNPLSATLVSGIAFGVVAWNFYGEASAGGAPRWGVLFFIVWGIFYAVIRLRTGSWLGLTVVQSLQSLTLWHMLPWEGGVASPALFYGPAGAIFLLVTWRLLPTRLSDIRV